MLYLQRLLHLLQCHHSALNWRIHRYPTHELDVVPEDEGNNESTASGVDNDNDDDDDEESVERRICEVHSYQDATKDEYQEDKSKEEDTGNDGDQSWSCQIRRLDAGI